MLRKISASNSSYHLGLAPQRKLLKVPSGQYAERLVAVITPSPSEIKYSYADKPHRSWTVPATIADDSLDQPVECLMDPNGNIHVVYSETGTGYLVSRKLSLVGGVWETGSKVAVYNGAPSLYPSLARESGGRLWVAWSVFEGGQQYVHCKASEDSGDTWGSGPSDPGDTLSNQAAVVYPKVVVAPNDIFVVFSQGSDTLVCRSRPLGGGTWTAEYIIHSGESLDAHFDVAVSTDGMLGIVFETGQIRYREYDGNAWGPVIVVDGDGGSFPQVVFNDNVPVIVYLFPCASGQTLIEYSHRYSGGFSAPAVLDRAAKQLDSVFAYHAGSAGFADLTEAAADATTADVFHPASEVLLGGAGDVLYLGMDQRFRYLKFLLSTAGVGGTVRYTYWDGTAWKVFTPVQGSFALDDIDADLELWDDYLSMPGDWQKCTVNGLTRYWIRLDVLSGYSAGPVGSQLTAMSDLQALVLRR